MNTRRWLLGAGALGLVGGALPFALRAQGLDSARIIVGFPPGGTTDVVAEWSGLAKQTGFTADS